MSPAEKDQEVRLISDVARWPHRIKLPVKRQTSSGPQTGLLLARGGHPDPVVYQGNVWDAVLNVDLVLGRYLSVEALVEDGWVGD